MKMSRLFVPSAIGTLVLKNRFIRSATWEGLATTNGEATPKLMAMMEALADGGVGLIISSHTFVSPEGQATPWQLGIHSDRHTAGLRRMTAAVHDRGGKILLQLAHAGIYAETALTGQPALAVSIREDFSQKWIHPMTPQDISHLITCYAKAAQRAQEAGFDGIELHAGHGYLLSQFLSPAFNKREDEYGGPITHRVRIHLQILAAIRKIVGNDFPILIKMNCCDFLEDGLTPEDSLAVAGLFSEAGFDAIEMSGGIIRTGKLSPSRPGIVTVEKEAYFKDYAQKFKTKINTPLILVGGIRSFEVAERIIAEGMADYLSMSRPLIREPGLIKRWQSGDLRKATCISDNLCFTPGFDGKGISCITREMQEKGIATRELTGEFS
jgi:2,4-dienoyl-CoA reductase-like NADH-dependent reductase (Old Yellow Enzyme family)